MSNMANASDGNLLRQIAVGVYLNVGRSRDQQRMLNKHPTYLVKVGIASCTYGEAPGYVLEHNVVRYSDMLEGPSRRPQKKAGTAPEP